ncbi:hybrid sensor histidine kinase/response regulator [uncultured Pseudacidovorax sp.]|uniref:ATP-binding response regulator n=1 Tax=uncultured Pseudacidovorax sp. TaxID=679313 RepID=UPI0025D48DF8|nr:hybrid sensor histidine kinase/response regulator [uncultured Pseudacidovorax sp.]
MNLWALGGSDSRPAASVSGRLLVVRGSLQRDLVRLGLLPCAVVALLLTGWLTHSRLAMLDDVFAAEGRAIARQVAAMSDLSLYAGDVAALQSVAQAALRGGQASRVEISNGAGIHVVAAGADAIHPDSLRSFTAPVLLREASRTMAFAPPGVTAAGDQAIGNVVALRDTTQLRRARIQSLLTGIGIGLLALSGAWLAVRHMARDIARPLRRLTHTVAALQAGQFDARCAIAGRSPRRGGPMHEFATLADDVNRMAEQLQRHKQASDERVREATAVALERMTEAEQAALSRSRFLAAASHDLRQPLHAMGLFIDGLLTGAADAQRPALLRLQESTAFMSLLLDDLLEISRLDARVLTPEVVDLPLAPLFDALAAQHAAHAAASRVRLVWRARGLAVRSDGGMLQRVIGNLVANAIRHSPPGGTVLVAARRRGGDRVRIEVRDRGVGIAPIHQQRIFEEFYQVANVERDRRQGFGLGLAICARLAMLLGSRIGLNSALGCGSTFSLALPQAQAAPRAAPLPAASVLPAEPSLAGLRCLMVDDDAHIRIATAELLAQWGCEAVCLASARDAVACLGAPGERFDLVLCDLQLAEGEDGLDVLAAARRLQPDALAVVISGATGPQALQRLRAAGATVLTKPVAPARLRALLATLK